MYSLEAALREMSRVVTMLARKVQMQVPASKDVMVTQQSAAVVGSCLPYPVQHTGKFKDKVCLKLAIMA